MILIVYLLFICFPRFVVVKFVMQKFFSFIVTGLYDLAIFFFIITSITPYFINFTNYYSKSLSYP